MLTRHEVTELVCKLVKAEGSEEEELRWLTAIHQSIPHPNIHGLIYWPQHYGLGLEPTVEEIVNAAYGYKPILL